MGARQNSRVTNKDQWRADLSHRSSALTNSLLDRQISLFFTRTVSRAPSEDNIVCLSSMMPYLLGLSIFILFHYFCTSFRGAKWLAICTVLLEKEISSKWFFLALHLQYNKFTFRCRKSTPSLTAVVAGSFTFFPPAILDFNLTSTVIGLTVWQVKPVMRYWGIRVTLTLFYQLRSA